MAKIDVHLKRCTERISQEIEDIKKEGEVAQDGINLVKYNAYDKDWGYSYYRLVSREPIFQGANGKTVKTQHLGDKYSPKTRRAIESIKRRKKLKILQKLFVHMEKSLHELKDIDT
jgi:hypothetical protein